MGSNVLEKLKDPSLSWNVPYSIGFIKRLHADITGTNQTTYMCNQILCFPVRFDGYLSWYNLNSGISNRVFNLGEAWDHSNETNPNTSYPYNGSVRWVGGYRSFFVGVHLTDGTKRVQVNILWDEEKYALLIFNTGKDGSSSSSLTVRVYDPPAFGFYSKAYYQTNGTRTGSNILTSSGSYTDLAPGKYILFYTTSATPDVDTSNMTFLVSPLGSNKRRTCNVFGCTPIDNELYVNAFTDNGINIPKMYLGVNAPSDMETGSSGRLIRTYRNTYITIGNITSSSRAISSTNVSGYFREVKAAYLNIVDDNPYAHTEGFVPFGTYAGWITDDSGSIKYIIESGYGQKHDVKWQPTYRGYWATIYDVDRDEEYTISAMKPLINIQSTGETTGETGRAVPNPLVTNYLLDLSPTSKLSVLSSNGQISDYVTSADLCWQYIDGIYGFCNWNSNGSTVCVEGLGMYTDDTTKDWSNIDPKYYWGVARCNSAADALGGLGIRPRIFDTSYPYNMNAGNLYLVITRQKEFSGTPDYSWFSQIQPKVLSSSDVNVAMTMFPYSVYTAGGTTDSISVTPTSSIQAGSEAFILVSCSSRGYGCRQGNKAHVMLVDSKGNIVAQGDDTLDSNGRAIVRIVVPPTVNLNDTYKIIAVIEGSRSFP